MTDCEKEYQEKMEVFENLESKLKSEYSRLKEKNEKIKSDVSLSEPEKKGVSKNKKSFIEK